MVDDRARASLEQLGLSDDELSTRRTVFASDALENMVVVLSGGTGGIGRAIAWLFARLGAHVVVVGRNQAKLDALASALAARELQASADTVDIKDPDAVKTLFNRVWSRHGRIDCLINSA